MHNLPAESLAYILQVAADDLKESRYERTQLLRRAMLLKPYHLLAKRLLYSDIQVDYTSEHPYTIEQDIQSLPYYHPASREEARLLRLQIDSSLARLARTLQASPDLKGSIYHLHLTATLSVVNDTTISRCLQTIRKYLAPTATISLHAPTQHIPILLRSHALAKMVTSIHVGPWFSPEVTASSKFWRLLTSCSTLQELHLNQVIFDEAALSALPVTLRSLHFYGCSDFPYNHLSLSLQNPNCLPALKELVIAPASDTAPIPSCDSGMDLDQDCKREAEVECGIWVKMQLEASAAGRGVSLRWC